MKKDHLPLEIDLLVNYPIVGRLQPVNALNEAISKLGTFNKNVTDFNGVISKFGTVNKDDYVKFRYLQLELIVKQCELLSDIAGYMNAIAEFSPKQTDAENQEMFMNVYKLFVCNKGENIHDFYENITSKDNQFFYNIMGYDILDSIDSNADIQEKNDELNNFKAELNESVKIVRSIFEEMSIFYKTFWRVYNAYKHGYRLFIDRAQCNMIECSGVSGNLDILIQDVITYVYKFGKPNKMISFSRSAAVYNKSFFNLFQGIVNAFTIRLVTLFQGFLNYDMSEVNIPSIRLFRHNNECIDIRLTLEFRSNDFVFIW